MCNCVASHYYFAVVERILQTGLKSKVTKLKVLKQKVLELILVIKSMVLATQDTDTSRSRRKGSNSRECGHSGHSRVHTQQTEECVV